MTAIDPRLLNTHPITVDLLVTLFADHHRGLPAVSSCPACGHRFTDTDTGDCPTNQIVRPLLRRRRHEQTGCLKPLTDIQHIDLIDTKPTVRKPARTPKPDVTLFALVLAFVIGAIAYRTHSNLAAFSTLAFTATAAITTWRNPT